MTSDGEAAGDPRQEGSRDWWERFIASVLDRVGQLEYVLVAGENGAPRRYVRTGVARHGGRGEVLSGLRPGEKVVLPADNTEFTDD